MSRMGLGAEKEPAFRGETHPSQMVRMCRGPGTGNHSMCLRCIWEPSVKTSQGEGANVSKHGKVTDDAGPCKPGTEFGFCSECDGKP